MTNIKTSQGFLITPGFILGLWEGDGTVSISVSVKTDNRTGFRVRLSFSIALHEKDISILLAIKEYLGVGSVEISNRNDSGNVYRYIVRNVNDLNNVIRPLILSPNILFRKRLNDTQLFLSALDILLAGTHNTESGLAQIRVLDSQLTGKMNKEEMNALPKSTTVITAEWFRGLVMAEGSFYAQIALNKTSALGSRVIVAFECSQELCEIDTVLSLPIFMGCGTVVNQHRHPSFRVQSRAQLIQYIFPFFEQYPVYGSKGHRLSVLKEIVNIMELNKPLTKVNLNKIAVLIATMKSTNY